MLDANDLPNDVDHLKRLVLEHRSRVQAQQLEIERLKIQLSRLRRWKFGRSSEQLDLEIAQIELTLQVLQAVAPPTEPTAASAPAAIEKAPSTRARRQPVRRALPEHLPRETIVHVSPEVRNGCACAHCGSKLRKLSEDVAEMLELVPGYFKVIRHVREKHSCMGCSGIVQAPAPSRPIERGLPGPGLLSHVVTGKCCYHQPLYRQSQIYGYAGVPIDRSTLTHWVGAASVLVSPLVQAIPPGRRHQRNQWRTVPPRSPAHSEETVVGKTAFGTRLPSISHQKEEVEPMVEKHAKFVPVIAHTGTRRGSPRLARRCRRGRRLS